MFVELDMPEYAIGDVKVGENITAKAYAYPGTEFTGRVSRISPAAQLQTTMGQSQGINTAESQTNYNIVRVLCEVDDPEGRLKPDMTGYAKVEGRVYPAAAAFLRPVVRLLMVEIWSWLP
jgi:multidrug resistance efflux pump